MFSKNLKKLRATYGLSVNDIAEKFGVKPRTWGAYERCEISPSIDFALLLNEKLDVNVNWLLTGNGEMFINTCENTHIKVKNNEALNCFESWGKRLSQLLSENKLTPHEFSKITGIQESRIEAFVVDSAAPRLEEINKVKSNFNVLIDWLLYGESAEKNTQADNGVSLSADEILKLKKLLKS